MADEERKKWWPIKLTTDNAANRGKSRGKLCISTPNDLNLV